MAEKTYSAGLISQSFWFIEAQKFIKLQAEGKSDNEIRRLCVEENLFGAVNEYRAKRVYGYIRNRVKRLKEPLTELFCASDPATQKIINLIAVIQNDRLFFEFLFEVYREKVILGAPVLDVADVRIFFKNKEVQSDCVAKWTDSTKRKLGSAYLNFMADANLLTDIDKEKRITPPILDTRLERYLAETGNSAVIRAVTGVD